MNKTILESMELPHEMFCFRSECVQKEGKWPLVSAVAKEIFLWVGIWMDILKIVYLTLRSCDSMAGINTW